MTKPKYRPKAATRSSARKVSTVSRKRSTSVSSKPAASSPTKQAHAIVMLRAPAGATIAKLMTATDWQPHSIRGFLAGIVRKKLGLNLVSDQTEKGRVYRIREGKAPPATAADRSK
jgi:hypothetical protein